MKQINTYTLTVCVTITIMENVKACFSFRAAVILVTKKNTIQNTEPGKF